MLPDMLTEILAGIFERGYILKLRRQSLSFYSENDKMLK